MNHKEKLILTNKIGILLIGLALMMTSCTTKVEQKKPEPEPEPVAAPVVVPAELVTISTREGRYYAVIGSFFDVDLAEDLGKELVASGISAYILQPSGDVVFHRVGLLMDNVSSMKEAEANLTSYREKYGNTVWAFKY